MLRNLIAGLLLTTALTLPAEAQSFWQGQSRIDSLQAQQEARIQAGVQNGTISASEATRLRARAAQIATLEARLRVNGLSYQERNRLTAELNQLNAQITREIHDYNNRFANGRFGNGGYGNNWNNGRFGDGGYGNNNGRFGNNNNFFGFGNVDSIQARQQAQIQAGLSSGRLTAQEAAKLQREFDRIAAREAQLRASGNNLSWQERNRLNQKLQQLSSKIQRESRDRQGRYY